LLSDLIQTYWTNFAKTGNPNAAGLPQWPAWSDPDKKFLLVNQDGSVTQRKNFPPVFSSLDAEELKRRFKAD
jgi:carboxylesterase type B